MIYSIPLGVNFLDSLHDGIIQMLEGNKVYVFFPTKRSAITFNAMLSSSIKSYIKIFPLGGWIEEEVNHISRYCNFMHFLKKYHQKVDRDLAYDLLSFWDMVNIDGRESEKFHFVNTNIFTELFDVVQTNWPGYVIQNNIKETHNIRKKFFRDMKLKIDNENAIPIVAGSTGTVPSTSNFMKSILDIGHIVLNGCLVPFPKTEFSNKHPQSSFMRLFEKLGTKKIELWPVCKNEKTLFLEESLLYPSSKKKLPDGITAILCKNTFQESRYIFNKILSSEEQYTIMTHDRKLVSYIKKMCDAEGIEWDDSAGTAMSDTELGSLFLHTAGMNDNPWYLLSSLKHPLSDDSWYVWAKYVENILRSSYRHSWKQSLRNDHDELWDRLLDSFSPPSSISFHEHLELHVKRMDIIASGWRDHEEYDELIKFIDTMKDMPNFLHNINSDTYKNWIHHMMIKIPIRKTKENPKLIILGPLEGRLLNIKNLIVSGLNQGSWPAHVSYHKWVGFESWNINKFSQADRRVGLSLHDLYTLFSAENITFTRAIEDDSGKNKQSQFWMRVLSDHEKLHIVEQKPKMHEYSVGYLEKHEKPKILSPSHIQTLARNPYEFYAKYGLRLEPLASLVKEYDGAFWGHLAHNMIEKDWSDGMISGYINLLDIPYPLAYLWTAKMTRIKSYLTESESNVSILFREKELSNISLVDDYYISGRPDVVYNDSEGEMCVVDYKLWKLPKKEDIYSCFEPQVPMEAFILGAKKGVIRSLLKEKEIYINNIEEVVSNIKNLVVNYSYDDSKYIISNDSEYKWLAKK
jgi:ATP-dependent helicase/nuclease subunit B